MNWRLLQLEATVREMEKRGNQVFYLLIANLGGIIAVLVSRLVSWPHS